MIKAIVGAGGKTSLIKECVKEYRQMGLSVFVTTSTHMFIEEDTLLTDDAELIIKKLREKGYAMAGIPEGQKIRALSYETYEQVCKVADVVLVEADGSKHLPIKFPKEGEPVIYDNVEEIVVVCGLHAIGKPVCQVAHRLELVKECLKITDDTLITAAHIQRVVKEGYVGPLRACYKEKTITIHPSGVDGLYQRAVAKLLEAEMDVNLIKEEWFLPQPSLVVCGAGHVSRDLVKMASCLDFRIKVIDDRPEFANRERFPEADEVICAGFEHLEDYLEPNAYYVVVTRGHKDDFECVKTILSHSYQYLGMIGSKKKVAKTFENLREAGITEEKISSVFAPIGLDIKAVTPAEIGVSILAQIILEKNKKQSSWASRTLLETDKSGTLCIIIEKTGSSPRGVGSMMFVTESEIIDSIGGGAIEFSAIEDARTCDHVMVKEYALDNEKSRALGMICGGSNKVLFIPIEGKENR